MDRASDEAVLRGVPLRIVNVCLRERYGSAALAHDLGRPSERGRRRTSSTRPSGGPAPATRT
ncbi:hypothetical protein ACFYZ8_19150 [Streptomyces sp. NPDC001668]|uniref:hypothetical protein n=1 Tax=unclassified Streptomyces TaxID=2593676 RepID=UPI0036CE8CEC